MAAPISQLLNLAGKVSIVTGGAMGIGLGIVSRLAEAGSTVIIADRDQAAGEKAAAQLQQKGYRVGFHQLDVSAVDAVQALVTEVIREFNQIDILVNNAGIYPNKPFHQMSLEDLKKVLSVNLEGVFTCTKAVTDQMISRGQGGKIINITSIDALHPSMVGLAHYDASKHGVWGFTKNIALELAEYKIWVNAVAPGGVLTPGVTGPNNSLDPKVLETFSNMIPMKRMGEPDDIAKAVLFLASDMSSYMTGSQIVVDGGVLLS